MYTSLNVLFLAFKLNTAYYVCLLNKNMKKHYYLPLPLVACLLFVSVVLQSCGGSTNLPIQEEEREQIAIEGQVSIIGENQEQGQENKVLPTLMPELWQCIFSYLNFEAVLVVRSVSVDWNELITGFREVGIRGVENKPSHIIDTRSWSKATEICFAHRQVNDNKMQDNVQFCFLSLNGKSYKFTPRLLAVFTRDKHAYGSFRL
jgi:hypothetical protein